MFRNKDVKKLSLAVSLVSISLASEAQRLEEITVIGVVPAGSSIDAAKLAYPIQNKKSGFYHLFEYIVNPEIISDLELEFRRDERFMRYLTVKLDKYGVEWAEKRRSKINSKES